MVRLYFTFFRTRGSRARLSVAVSERGEHTVITLAGVLETSTAHRLVEAIEAAATRPSPRVTLFMADVEFIDGRGLAALVRARNRLWRAGGELSLCAVPELAMRLLDLCGLSAVFPVASAYPGTLAPVPVPRSSALPSTT